MPAVSLHGVTIAWSDAGPVAGLSFDPLAELLSELAPATEDHASTTTVRFELRPAHASDAADPRSEGWTPSFFHGVVETFRNDEGFVIWDGASRVLVPYAGTPIEARVAPPERAIYPGSLTTVFQLALALALRPMGLFHLHAAALVLPSGAPVLVIGGSGAGKTSTTLALLEANGATAGVDYLGDDSLYLTRASPDAAPEVIAFPREFHLGKATLEAAPRLTTLVGAPAPDGKKGPLDARRAYPGRFRPSLSLTPAQAGLALFPSITTAPQTEVVPLARAEAFGLLLGSSGAIVVDGIPGRDENLALLSALLRAVRCYEVRLGADALTDPVSAVAKRVVALAEAR